MSFGTFKDSKSNLKQEFQTIRNRLSFCAKIPPFLKILNDRSEEAKAYTNLGIAHHYQANYDQALTFHGHVLRLAQELRDKEIEVKAYAGLGHAAR